MAYDQPDIEVGKYRLIYEDIDAHQTKGIPSAEVSEIKGFLKSAVGAIDASSKAARQLSQESDKKGNPERICVTISHTMNRFTALATYHLRVYSDKMIFLDCERDEVKNSEGR